MSYNTVPIKKDVDGKPIPQLYNEIANEYEVLKGQNGASRTVLYDNNGNEVNLTNFMSNVHLLLREIKSMNYDQLNKQVDILNKLSPKTHYLLSTENKPTTASKGENVFEIDTSDVYMWDGAEWVVI